MSTPEWAADVADIVPPEAWQRLGGEWRARTEHGLWQVYNVGTATLSKGHLAVSAYSDEEAPPVLRAMLAGLRAMEAEHKRQTAKVDLDTVEAWEMVRLEWLRHEGGSMWSDVTDAARVVVAACTPESALRHTDTMGWPAHRYRIVHRETGAVLAGEGADD